MMFCYTRNTAFQLYIHFFAEYSETPADKRNIQSIKANKHRNKREAADYFENEMVYQIPPDYEEMLQELAASQDYYPVEDKRFLGKLMKFPLLYGLCLSEPH